MKNEAFRQGLVDGIGHALVVGGNNQESVPGRCVERKG